MKAINICKDEAESIQELLPNECLISIHNTTNPPWNLKVGGERVLKVYFDDVPFPLKHNDLQYSPINTDQAREIIDFVEKWEGHDFLINCHAGISRSGAVAMALHILLNYELKPNFYKVSDVNALVLGILIKEYKYKNSKGITIQDWNFRLNRQYNIKQEEE